MNFHLNNKTNENLEKLTNDCYSMWDLDNTFTIVKLNNDLLYLIYATTKLSIISYDLINNKKISEIKNAHNNYITNFRYYLNEINKMDLIMSISANDNNLKIWNFKNWECLLNLQEFNQIGRLYSACILSYKCKIYIITSGWDSFDYKPLKVYDINGVKIKQINNSDDRTFLVDIYYDINLSKYFIITGNKGNVKSYDFINNQIYHKYDDKNYKSHFSFIIFNDKELIKLVESGCDGYIRIWNFHSEQLLGKILILLNNSLRAICLWNNEFILVGCDDGIMRLVNIKEQLIVDEIIGHDDRVITIKKVIHPKYGECLISQSWGKKQIKFWVNNI